MRDKTRKLAEQYGDRFATDARNLFRGKTFWATGRMEGIDVDLKEIITKNGGVYEQYGFRSVSHVIASNVALSNQNWKKLLGGRRSYKSYYLVTPQWILDSVEAGKCLRESDYLPECIRDSGTLDQFFNGTPSLVGAQEYKCAAGSNSGVLPSLIARPNESYKRIIRADAYHPSDVSSVVDEFCYEFLNCKKSLMRRAFISIYQADSIIVFGLSVELLRLSLADALVAELQGRDLIGVEKISLSVYEGVEVGRELRIVPLDTDPPPSVFNNHILDLFHHLRDADEDSMPPGLDKVLIQGSTAVNAIIIDVLNHHISARRADLARDLLLRLGHLVSRLGRNRELQEWYDEIYKSAQDIFKWHNEGMRLRI